MFLVILPLVLILACGGVMAYIADRVSRPERQPLRSTPAAYGLPYEDVGFRSAVDHIPLSGWLIPGAGAAVIMMLHGRGQTRESEEAFLEKAALFAGQGYGVLMFDFRGHGESGGQRYAFGQWETRDLAGALRFLTDRGYTTIGTYGVSMGAAISLLAAPAQPEIRALWVDSPFMDLRPLIRRRVRTDLRLPACTAWGILAMARLLYGIDLAAVQPGATLARLGNRPVYHVHSAEGDDWVPLRQARALARIGARNPHYTFWIAPGAGHVQAYTNNKAEYTRRMLAFYAHYLPAVRQAGAA